MIENIDSENNESKLNHDINKQTSIAKSSINPNTFVLFPTADSLTVCTPQNNVFYQLRLNGSSCRMNLTNNMSIFILIHY
jgi:hypothetical protein